MRKTQDLEYNFSLNRQIVIWKKNSLQPTTIVVQGYQCYIYLHECY